MKKMNYILTTIQQKKTKFRISQFKAVQIIMFVYKH